jgi:hypothetical protein
LVIHTLYRANPYLPTPVCAVELLGSPSAISFRQVADGLHLTLPAVPPAGGIAYVFRIDTRCPASLRP